MVEVAGRTCDGSVAKMNDIEFTLWDDISVHAGVKLTELHVARFILDLGVRFVVQLRSTIMTKRFLDMDPSVIEWATERSSSTQQGPGRILFTYDNYALFVTRYVYNSIPARVDLDPTVSEVVTFVTQSDGSVRLCDRLPDGPRDLCCRPGGIEGILQMLTTQPLNSLAPYADQLFDICQQIETLRLDGIASSSRTGTYNL